MSFEVQLFLIWDYFVCTRSSCLGNSGTKRVKTHAVIALGIGLGVGKQLVCSGTIVIGFWLLKSTRQSVSIHN